VELQLGSNLYARYCVNVCCVLRTVGWDEEIELCEILGLHTGVDGRFMSSGMWLHIDW